MSCRFCGKSIEYGQPYKWFASKIGRMSRRSNYHQGCKIPPSHRTTSKMGTIYDAQEEFVAGDSPDEIRNNVSAFAEVVREVAEEYRESAQNMEEGFGHSTYQSDELTDRADQLESWADDLDSVDIEDDEPTEDDLDEDEELEDKIEEWLDSQREVAYNAVNESPV